MSEDLTEFADYREFALPDVSSEPHVTLNIPPQLVWECAAGLEDPVAIARRFNLSDEQWARLSQWPAFINAVQAQRAQFEREGMTFRLKASLMADEVMDGLFKQTISLDSTISQKLSVLNTLVDIAGIKNTKKEDASNAAPKFSITINIPQGTQPLTIDG